MASVLERARGLGLLGPGPIDAHLAHSAAFVSAWDTLHRGPPGDVLDLGSGGGVPGLPLILTWPDARFVLLDSQRRRCDFLEQAVRELGVSTRVRVVCGRAEELACGDLRGQFSLVTARGFGPPAVTAECAAAFLRRSGCLEVADPPGADPARWPAAPLATLGLAAVDRVVTPASVTVLRLVAETPPWVPRRSGLPAKRPLWNVDRLT
ncbi:MAG: 16S rRNA (guanine(527)-N(7))-methyltransferase RsmG [Acidimicrobiales bacterium]